MPERTHPVSPPEPRRADLSVQVRTALGFPRHAGPRAELGESDRKVAVWSVLELDAAYQRVGGLVTASPLTTRDGHESLRLGLTAYVPGIGALQAFTFWEPVAERYGFLLDVVRVAAGPQVAAARVAELHREAAIDYAEAAEYAATAAADSWAQIYGSNIGAAL